MMFIHKEVTFPATSEFVPEYGVTVYYSPAILTTGGDHSDRIMLKVGLAGGEASFQMKADPAKVRELAMLLLDVEQAIRIRMARRDDVVAAEQAQENEEEQA